MTARERLHQLVDELGDEETAEALEQLAHWRAGRGMVAGLEYGPDFAPLRDEDRTAIERAEAEIDAGEYVGEERLRAQLEALRRRGG
jgi:hypothetical protein